MLAVRALRIAGEDAANAGASLVGLAAQLADRVIVLSESPGKIRYQLNIQAPRPRDPTQPDVVRSMHLILTKLNVEHDAGEYADAR